ncbi:MAG: type II secretion system secretin GspD [Thermodesulfobacteriota bacterium]
MKTTTKFLLIIFIFIIILPNSSHSQEVHPSKEETTQQSDTILLNFVDANLKDILQTVGDITEENFILAPGVGGRITVQSSKPIPKADLFEVFESILEANGFSAVKTGTYYKIVPAPEARRKTIDIQEGRDRKSLPSGEKVMTQVVPIEFISSKDIVPILQPMLSRAGLIVNYIKGNILIITDVSANIKKLFSIIEVLDVDVFKEKKIEIFTLTNVDAKDLHKELLEILRVLGLDKDAAQLSIVPIERLNSIIVFSSNPSLLNSVKEWIDRLDKTLSPGSSIHIHYLQNEKASNVKTVIDQLFGGKVSAKPKTRPQTTAPPRGRTPTPVPTPRPSSAAPQQDEVKIYLYEPANALIIQATLPDYINILKIIKQLDRQPKEVLIDALIAEVKLDESSEFGIQWSFLKGNVNTQLSSGIISSELVNPSGNVSIPANTTAPGGLSFLVTDAKKFFNIIQALASQGKVNILSNPHIVVRNNEKASINVGSDEPIATKASQTTTTTTGQTVQDIEYRKTGVILTVTPDITEGGVVAMDVRQEVSDIGPDRTVGNATYPSFIKREVETHIVTRDGESIVIGGLIQERTDETITGVPILSKVPILGHLFRYTTDTLVKTELVVLLTPRVIWDIGHASDITKEFKNSLEGLKDMLEKQKKIISSPPPRISPLVPPQSEDDINRLPPPVTPPPFVPKQEGNSSNRVLPPLEGP